MFTFYYRNHLTSVYEKQTEPEGIFYQPIIKQGSRADNSPLGVMDIAGSSAFCQIHPLVPAHPLYISNGSSSKVIGSSSAVCGYLCSPMSDGKGVHAVSEDDSFIVVGAESDFVDFFIYK